MYIYISGVYSLVNIISYIVVLKCAYDFLYTGKSIYALLTLFVEPFVMILQKSKITWNILAWRLLFISVPPKTLIWINTSFDTKICNFFLKTRIVISVLGRRKILNASSAGPIVVVIFRVAFVQQWTSISWKEERKKYYVEHKTTEN